MFGSTVLDRRSKPERVADEAWEQLLSFADSARDSTRSARRRTAELAGDVGGAAGTVSVMADEARRRALAAYDALAGRGPSFPWALVLGATAVGAALGWAIGSASRAAIARMGDEPEASVENIEFVDADRPRSSLDR